MAQQLAQKISIIKFTFFFEGKLWGSSPQCFILFFYKNDYTENRDTYRDTLGGKKVNKKIKNFKQAFLAIVQFVGAEIASLLRAKGELAS